MAFDSPPFFTSQWLGCHPHDRLPRVVECFGPSRRDAQAAEHAAVLGLRSMMRGKSPTLSKVSAEFDGQRLVLYSRGRELMRTDLLPLALVTMLKWRAEVLLVWVDVPLHDPRAQISLVGLRHVWTGLAPVDGCDPWDAEPLHDTLSAGSWGTSTASDEEMSAGLASPDLWRGVRARQPA